MPQWRVGQQAVPKPLVKGAQQQEAERRAAKVIAQRIEAPEPLKPVAAHLSQSLGEPAKDAATIEAADAQLVIGIRGQQTDLAKLNVALATLDGKKIEGTGVNLFGWAGGLGGVLIIAACIACPSLIGVFWWFMKRSAGALRTVVHGVENFQEAHPDEALALKGELSKVMDESHKLTVAKVKATL